ncbi:hypothetical protein PG985_016406 [Apiospora marii]|uniref:Zn(2)-C6 fungal-type domain-containing protein n=1 Tax=Apiospora marii TaxID=335849 RepID=A0ABR1R452_9PEZI
MASPSSESSQRLGLTPKPSFPRRHRASGLDLPRGPGLERYHPGGRSAAGRKPGRNPWDPVPPRLQKPEKAARPEPIPDSDVADGEDEEDLGTPTEAISPPTPPPPALPAPMTTSITMQGISDRPAAQPPVRSDSFWEQDPDSDTPGEKTVHGEGERIEFRRWVYRNGRWLLESFDPLRDPLQLPPIRATLVDPDTGSLIPPPPRPQPRMQPRVQGEIRHALPTLEDRKAAKVVSGSAETTTANSTPPQGRKRKLSPSKKQPAAPVPAPSVASTPSASPPAAPAPQKKPHAKTKNAILRANALDENDGEPNPDGPCVGCSKSQTKRASCRTAKDRTTGTKCNHCTRNKILCAKLPKPEPQPAPPPPPADYDPDETEVEEDAVDEEMRDAAPAVRRL